MAGLPPSGFVQERGLHPIREMDDLGSGVSGFPTLGGDTRDAEALLMKTAADGDTVPSKDVVDIEPVSRYAGLGVSVASLLTENLLSHPCIVIRRQCQVHRTASKYHLSPFTLIPVIIRLQKRQGLVMLWKGAPSVFLVQGLTMVTETVLTEVTPFPREITIHSSLKHMAQHILLKSLTFAIITPFYCASSVEVVQSDIASEKPGVLDCLREGFSRMFKWGAPASGRLLPIWKLIGPTVIHGVLRYTVASVSQSVALWWINLQAQRRAERTGAIPRNLMSMPEQYFSELMSVFIGNFVADVLLYPLETVLNRLYLQGTRTIIDNLDNGASVIPVISQYEGPLDCFHCIVAEEGAAGLYKGFGALILQYSLHFAILKLTRIVFEEITLTIKRNRGQE